MTLGEGLVVAMVSYGALFLKGFQHRNVNHGNRRLIVIFSYAMAIFDVLSVTLIARHGIIAALPVGTGASLGMLTALYVHDRFVTKPKE